MRLRLSSRLYPFLSRVLADMGRNSRTRAWDALQSDQVRNLGIHLMKWVLFPSAQPREHWRVEAENALIDLFSDLVEKSHKIKDYSFVFVDRVYFGPRDIQKALDGQTHSILDRALRSYSGSAASNDITDQDTFSNMGFTVLMTDSEILGKNINIAYRGTVLVDTRNRLRLQ